MHSRPAPGIAVENSTRNLKRRPSNERAKRAYLQFLSGTKSRDEASLDALAKALERFDEYNRRCDFAKFHPEQARSFKANLVEQRNATPSSLRRGRRTSDTSIA
jgi:hypothetical protein